jgi:hypothetical protein
MYKWQGWWIKHLEDNNMTYCQHLRFAIGGATCIIYYGVKLATHAIMPCFNRTALSDVQCYASGKRAKSTWENISDRHRTRGITLNLQEGNNEHTNSRVCTPSTKKNS